MAHYRTMQPALSPLLPAGTEIRRTPPRALNNCSTYMRLNRRKINTYQNSGINCNRSYNSLFLAFLQQAGQDLIHEIYLIIFCRQSFQQFFVQDFGEYLRIKRSGRHSKCLQVCAFDQRFHSAQFEQEMGYSFFLLIVLENSHAEEQRFDLALSK